VLFDLDGTLCVSSGLDDACFAAAAGEALGVPAGSIDTDWSVYREVTDAAIARELIGSHGLAGGEASSAYERMRRLFCGLVAERSRDRGSCVEVPGAGAFLRRLEGMPGVRVAVATGGWRCGAEAKLAAAGIGLGAGTPLVTSDDEPTRLGLLRRAMGLVGGGDDVRAVAFGDGGWDVRAASAAGVGFVGLDAEGRGTLSGGVWDGAVVTGYEDAAVVMRLARSAAR